MCERARACVREERARERDIPVGGQFIEFSVVGENENTDIGITENGELLGLLKEPSSALTKGNLPVHRILNSLHLNLSTSHLMTNLIS